MEEVFTIIQFKFIATQDSRTFFIIARSIKKKKEVEVSENYEGRNFRKLIYLYYIFVLGNVVLEINE